MSLSAESTAVFFICVVFITIVALWYCSSKIVVVNQAHVVIAERFGKFSRLLSPGIHFLSFFEKPRQICASKYDVDTYGNLYTMKYETPYIDLREQIMDVPIREFISRDTVLVSFDALIFYRIVDPLSAYRINNLPNSLELLCVSSLRNIVASLSLDDTFTTRSKLNLLIKRQMESDCARYGVVITRVCVEDVDFASDIVEAMEIQKLQERKRIAKLITANSQRERDIIKAKGDATKRVLSADAERHANIARTNGHAQAKIIEAQCLAERFQVAQHALGGKYRASDYLYTTEYLATLPSCFSGARTSLVPQSFIDDVAAQLHKRKV